MSWLREEGAAELERLLIKLKDYLRPVEGHDDTR